MTYVLFDFGHHAILLHSREDPDEQTLRVLLENLVQLIQVVRLVTQQHGRLRGYKKESAVLRYVKANVSSVSKIPHSQDILWCSSNTPRTVKPFPLLFIQHPGTRNFPRSIQCHQFFLPYGKLCISNNAFLLCPGTRNFQRSVTLQLCASLNRRLIFFNLTWMTLCKMLKCISCWVRASSWRRGGGSSTRDRLYCSSSASLVSGSTGTGWSDEPLNSYNEKEQDRSDE